MEDENIKKLENEEKVTQTETKTAGVAAPAAAKRGGKMKVAMAGCAILAMVGIGFGAYGVVQGDSKDAEIERLTTKLKENGVEVETKVEEEEKAEDTTKNEPTKEVAVASGRDYIYIGEWGIKIKVPTGLGGISYVYTGTTLYVTAADCSDGACQYVPEFVKVATSQGSGLGALSRFTKAEADEMAKIMNEHSQFQNSGTLKVGDLYGLQSPGMVVFIDREGYYYVYSHPQALHTSVASEKDWELRSVEKVGEMLRNNISEF